jgi:aspartate carbamoyltransferase catalytic subunit
MLDLYTLRQELGKTDGVTLALCGDLKNGRTVHSGVEIYKHFGIRLILVAPDALKMPAEVTDRLRAQGVAFEETTDLGYAVKQADALYMTRIQKERFSDLAEYERLKGAYILTREMVETLNPRLVTLHPLPRVNEIATDVDSLAGAAYFRQARNGVFVRMALIALVMGKA